MNWSFCFCFVCVWGFFPLFFLKMSSLNLSCCWRLSQGNLHGCCAILMQRCPLVFESVDPKMSVHPPFRFKSFWSTMAPKPIRGTPRKKDLESTITTRRECQLIDHETIRTHLFFIQVCVRTQKSNTHNCQVFYNTNNNTNLCLHISRFFFLAILTHRPVLSMWKTINICPW